MHAVTSSQDSADDALDEVDVAWQRRRSSLASLVLGVIGIALSPLLLGLVVGPLSVREGMQRWRAGLRRPTIAIGIASGLTAIVLSTMAALLWGSLLTTVLLGRDALREADRLRGQQVGSRSVPMSRDSDATADETLLPAHGSARRIVLFVDIAQRPSRDAIAALLAFPGSRDDLVLVDRSPSGAPLAALARDLGLGPCAVVPYDAVLPPPIESVAALPMTMSIDAAGRIEGALIGVRPPEELGKLLGGEMALPPATTP